MNIILLGYMGCGKSLISRQLADDLEMDYIDLDNYIEGKEKKSISEIFKDHGEIYFRKKETLLLKKLIEETDNNIISLGGGTPCFSKNMETINSHPNNLSVYLKTSIPTLADRLISEKNTRPLIAHLTNKEELTEFIGKHLFERSFYYNQAEIVIDTDQKTPEEISHELKERIILE